METTFMLDGVRFADMIQGGYANLRTQASRINDLNVFPIPDGDTGDNMLLTMLGGVDAGKAYEGNLSETSRKIADGMLLSARGNSGVILSQFFDGIAAGFEGIDQADSEQVGHALRCGVKHAYRAVLKPTEGTVLTVAREATEYACAQETQTPYELMQEFLSEARRTLDKTPDMLPVLKKAGVVDSGGAGLICIMEGMTKILNGELIPDGEFPETKDNTGATQEIDISLFDENSVLEFGYCTELLLRLQTAKTDINNFDITVITDYLQQIGDSVAAFKTGTIVKIHVHTMTPDKALSYCQQYGEFLKIKIENMSLQHNNSVLSENDNNDDSQDEIREHTEFGVVAVCSGEGVSELFTERGADIIVSGGQSMNPSAEDFIEAFKKVNADTIFVLPNNSNIILAARQAASMFTDSDVRVIESRTIGDGFAALSMYDTYSGDADIIESELKDAMVGVVTAEISQAVRDTGEVHTGEYIGFIGKDILVSEQSRLDAACRTVDKIGIDNADLCLIIYGNGVSQEEADKVQEYVSSSYPGKEAFVYEGRQEIYDYIIILQ